MKAFVITLKDKWESRSQQAAQRCIASIDKTNSKLQAEMFEATTPLTINDHMKQVWGKAVEWSWPMDEGHNGYCLATGIYKKHYPARDQLRVVACAVSHARLWNECVTINEPIAVLEHDSVFVRTFDPSVLDGFQWSAVSLNDPRGATRKSRSYYEVFEQNKGHSGVFPVPTIDGATDLPLASGLPGNSAYVIKPSLAKQLLDMVNEIGLWPNDALMCKQLFKNLKVSVPFYTQLQGIESTTTR